MYMPPPGGKEYIHPIHLLTYLCSYWIIEVDQEKENGVIFLEVKILLNYSRKDDNNAYGIQTNIKTKYRDN